MIMTPWKSLAPWVLPLVQEPYLWYIHLYQQNLGHKIYTTIIKNHMKKTIDAIIGEKQSAAIKKQNDITHIFQHSRCNWCSHNLNSRLAWTSLNFREPFTEYLFFLSLISLFCHKFVIRKLILLFSSLVMETNSFRRLKFRTPISNLKLKKMISYLNLLPL